MLKQVEGSHAVAEAVALCRPEVISAYPITPQTHIVEDLGTMVKSGQIDPCEFLLVESEFGALSACIGSSAAGARSYTATSSQGMLFMMEAVYNASGMGLPIVMTEAIAPLVRRSISGTTGATPCQRVMRAGFSCSPKATSNRSTCISRPSSWPRN